jgi:hypothetical protein
MAEFDDKVKAAFDAEFERTRPRPGLRGRVIANAVATPRTRQGFGAWLTPPRLATVAAAVALLVVAGVGLRIATQGALPTAKTSPSPSAADLAFGKLPPPGLHPPTGLGGGGGAPTLVPYFGPAALTWSGQLPTAPSSAPVYRFALPTIGDDDAFASRLGAKLLSAGSGKGPRSYQGPDGYTMDISDDTVAGERVFVMNREPGPSPRQSLTEDGARSAADAELTRLGLTPSWNFTVQVSQFTPLGESVPIFVVQYQRLVQVSSTVTAGEVDGNGDPAGIQVMVDSGGRAIRVAGPLRLAEQPAAYPLRAPATVVHAAVTATPVTNESGSPPAVTLTQATLVYATVVSGGVGYMEPAYLFTGRFTLNGYPYEKRVLIPAVAPRALG